MIDQSVVQQRQKRDPKRTEKIRIAARYLLREGHLRDGGKGHQSGLAKYFKVTRQRVHQIVKEERLNLELTDN